MTDPRGVGQHRVETTGETVGEAKWHALRERLLGVGYAPARVIATVDAAAAPEAAPPAEPADDSGLAADVRELLERITTELGVHCRIELTEDEEAVTGSLAGDDLGLLIGRHGQTIDAIQYLANVLAWRAYGEGRKDVVVDAAGYRDRRRAALESLALRSAERAKATGEPVELDPMTSIERRIVHLCLQEIAGVSTRSEGTEPHRYVVVDSD